MAVPTDGRVNDWRTHLMIDTDAMNKRRNGFDFAMTFDDATKANWHFKSIRVIE